MKIQKNILLKNYTTFRIGGPAKYFFVAKTKEELIEAIKWAKNKSLPFFILGGGSNLLVSDKGHNGLVIKLLNTKYKILNTKVYAEAGLTLGRLVRVTAEAGLEGMEWAAGIPGTVGGAIYGNAGAFGGEMKDVIQRVEVFDAKDLGFKVYNLKDCKFGYRESIFKKNQNLIILSCQLKFKKGNKKEIKEKIQEYLNYRNRRHPKEPSAGSCFKNPNSIPAAILIHRCGLTGKKIGRAQISKLHSNFIINLGGAKAKDVLRLINLIKNKIKRKFGIKPKEEVQFLGRF